MVMINRFVIALVLLGCSLLVQSFSFSSLPSKRSSNNRQHHHQQLHECSYLSVTYDNNNNNNKKNEQDKSVTFQKAFAACFVTAALWMSPVVLEQSNFPIIISSQAVSAKEMTSGSSSRENKNKDRTAAYARNADLFVGGYTVEGTKLSIIPGTAPGTTQDFRVAQECICSATATKHGIFASGANLDNAFLFVATLDDKGEQWTAEQTSVGATPPYKATMQFGATAGGPHTAIGSTLSKSGATTAFAAEQSAMGCTEGTAACETVFGKHGLSWDMIRRRCGL